MEKEKQGNAASAKNTPVDNPNDNNDESACTDRTTYQDTSTECAICFGSLEEDEVITLTTCGHKWHLECLKDQLQHAQPNPGKRLLFSGCRCAKCGIFCDHPALRHLTNSTDELRLKVDELIKTQVLADNNNSTDHLLSAEALDDARRRYAFYLCSSCQEPYFGGTIDCADTAQGEVPPKERLCVACAPSLLQSQQCRQPLQHRGFHVWKCRYCCQVATHVCYGTVHFCNDCHDRNSQHVQQQQQSANSNINQPPDLLQALPCPGEECIYPKRPNETHHQNGTSAACEQVYHCGACQQDFGGGNSTNTLPGSRNLLYNASGQEGLQGWQQFHRGHASASWTVESSDLPVSRQVTTNFVSSFQWCVMAQSVPLQRYLRPDTASTAVRPRFEASAKYMARTDCPSLFQLEVLLVHATTRATVVRKGTPVLTAPADCWERASLIVEPDEIPQHAVLRELDVILVVRGKDQAFWQGRFGSKVTECTIRLLGSPTEEVEQWLLPQEDIPQQQGGA